MIRPFGDGPVQKGFSAMLWRHLCLVRAGLAAGLVSGLTFMGASTATAQTTTAGCDRSASPRRAGRLWRPRPSILTPASQGRRSRQSSLAGQGHGTCSSVDSEPVDPPVECYRAAGTWSPASATGQPGGGGGAGACRAWVWAPQPIAMEPSATFRARAPPTACGRSGPPTNPAHARCRSGGRDDRLDLPAVCLNYGLADPYSSRYFHARWQVEEYSSEPARSQGFAEPGNLWTPSLGVAQSVMWRVCNDLPFETDGRASREGYEHP